MEREEALLTTVAAPIPKFEGLTLPPAPPGPAAPVFTQPPPGPLQPQLSGLQPQNSGSGPIRVPPLNPAKVAEYAGLFEKSGAINGLLSGKSLAATEWTISSNPCM